MRSQKEEEKNIEEKKKEINKDVVEEQPKHSKLKKILILLLLVIVVIFVYIRFIATSGFIVKEYGVYSDKLPSNFNGFKIAHLSDIHYGSIGRNKLDDIVKEVNKMKPDIIVFTGDLYDEYTNLTDDMKQNIIDSLSKLESKLGKFAISGNHDYSFEGYKELIEASGFTYLHNESKTIYYYGSEPIDIVGYPSIMKDSPDYNIELSSNFKIALIHEGDQMDNLVDKGFDIVLAGHSHNGQVKLPFIGPIILPDYAKKYYDEYYEVNNTKLYISNGLGETQLRIRAFNKPSFNFYRLYTK